MDTLDLLVQLSQYSRYLLLVVIGLYVFLGWILDRFFSLETVLKIEKIGLYFFCLFFLSGDIINYAYLETLQRNSISIKAVVSGSHSFYTRKGKRTGPVLTVTDKNYPLKLEYRGAIFKDYSLNEKVEMYYYLPNPIKSIPNNWDAKYSRFMLLPLPLFGLIMLIFRPHKTLFPRLMEWLKKKEKSRVNNMK